MLIPFTKPEMVAAGLDCDTKVLQTYNFYLSQLRMRIKMSFGRLTTKWRLLRKTLNYKLEKNAKIVRVCTKLHNYCIRMEQKDGGGRIGIIEGEEFDPVEHGIDPMTGTGNQNSNNGFLETSPLDDTTVPPPMEQFSSLLPDASRRESIVKEIISWGLWRPDHNMERNHQGVDSS